MTKLSLLISALLMSLYAAFALAQEPATENGDDYPPPVPVYDPTGPMHFFVGWNGGAFLNSAEFWIAAEGIITKDTPAQFAAYLKKDWDFNDQNADIGQVGRRIENVYLHSCGGEEEAAMQLGRLFQKHKFTIFVGQTFRDPDFPENSAVTTGNGECRGACILAALGGSKSTKGELKSLASHDLGNGKTTKGDTYIPIILPYFSTPRERILAYAQSRGINRNFLDQLLPRSHGETRTLNLVEAARIGTSIDYFPYSNVPPPYSKPCP